MPAEGVFIDSSGIKKFIPLENNPEVFTSLVHDLGVSPKLGFYDVWSLDNPDLLAHVPRPVLALIFITPGSMYWAVRGEEGTPTAEKLSYDKTGDDEPVMWFLQTIGNACGLIALLHSVANGPARNFVTHDSFLDGLIKQTKDMGPKARADTLYNSQELEDKHMRAAYSGSSAPPPAEDHPDLHFLAYVKGKDEHLWELEGGCDGPLDRGAMQDGDDMLSEDALAKGVRRFLKHSNGNLRFSIVALAEKPAE